MSTPPFIIASENAVNALPVWLAGLNCNTCSHDCKIIRVGRRSGRKYTYIASIIIRDEKLFDVTLEAVKATVFSDTSA